MTNEKVATGRATVVAIVDDEESVRAGLGSLMRSADIAADLFSSADELLLSDLSRYFCVLSDIQMPGKSGLELLSELTGRRTRLPVVLMTAFSDRRVRERANDGGAYRFLEKPCDPDELIAVVESLLPGSR
jgi:FixJ family two-component response regulator